MSKRKNIKFIGVVSVSPQGFGFVENGDATLFIPPGMLNGAISGDEVEADIDPKSDLNRPSGSVKRILSRKFGEIVGCLVPWHGGWAIRPLRHELPPLIELSAESCSEKHGSAMLKEGNWAVAALPVEQKTEKWVGELKEIMDGAGAGNVSADLDAVVAAFSLPEQYSEEMERAADKLVPAKIRRAACPHECIVTIDPVDARDYDDALSCEIDRKSGNWIVGVHIADVACFVLPGSPFDKEAAERGFTSYLPGRTIPMLPRALANGQCSLKSGEERLAHTVYITIDPSNGDILKWHRQHTAIKVTQRLCYEQVQRFLDGEELEEARPGVCELINRLNHIAQLLRRHRSAVERFLPMAMPEIRAVCSENPSAILGVKQAEDNPSHHLVEEFMLAANQCVALELLQRKLPGLFRNHSAPEMEKMEEFALQSAEMLNCKVPALGTRAQIVNFLRQAEKSPLKVVLYMTFLRNLPRADYGVDSLGHFGLGKEFYCHFTSPIRRYSDLLIHRQLIQHDCRRKEISRDKMAEAAAKICAQEFNCDSAQFAAEDRMKIRYIKQLDEKQDGFVLVGDVCRVAKTGLSIYLAEYGLMASVMASDLPRGWNFDAAKKIWKNIHDGSVFKIADRLRCKLLSADAVRGELQVLPENLPRPDVRLNDLNGDGNMPWERRMRAENDEGNDGKRRRLKKNEKKGRGHGGAVLSRAEKKNNPFYARFSKGRRRGR